MTQTMRWRRIAPVVATTLLALGACRQSKNAVQLPAADPSATAATSAPAVAAGHEANAPSGALGAEQPTLGASPAVRTGGGTAAGGLTFNGNTEAFRRSTLAPQVGGVVARVLAREGERVRRGAALVVIETASFALRLRGAEAARAVARAQRDAVMVEWRKLSQLVKARAVPPSQYDTINAQLRTAEAAVAQADVGVALAQHDLANTVVRAPFDAMVTRRLIDPGEYAAVMPPTPLLTVEEIDTLELRVQVPETAMAQVPVGTPIEARFTAIGRSVSARIARVVPALDPATRSLSAIAELPNADHGLRPGMFAEVRVLTTPAPGAP